MHLPIEREPQELGTKHWEQLNNAAHTHPNGSNMKWFLQNLSSYLFSQDLKNWKTKTWISPRDKDTRTVTNNNNKLLYDKYIICYNMSLNTELNLLEWSKKK